MNIKIDLPQEVKFILKELNKYNFEAYIVGGCVRDSLLKREINDWDITTNAKPNDIISIFNKTIPTGIKHGTVTTIINNKAFEVTTYRIDGEYIDGRHPKSVLFINNLKEDLKRRDFTINALAYNEEKGLVDYFNGVYDLKLMTIRTVGDPYKRFNEDALRMMRCIRFASQLNFKIENETLEAIKKLSSNLKKVSVERIRNEFNKILIANPKYVNNLINIGLIDCFLPELIECRDVNQQNPHHIYNVLDHIIKSTENIEKSLHLRITMLFHDIYKPKCKTVDENGIGHFYSHEKKSAEMAMKILRRLKYDNDLINKVVILIRYHDRVIATSKSIKKILKEIGEDAFYDLLKVKEADLSAQAPMFHEEGYKLIKESRDEFIKILENKECFKIKDLTINGNILKDIGIKDGKAIGYTLNMLLEEVIENPNLNNKESLIKRSLELNK